MSWFDRFKEEARVVEGMSIKEFKGEPPPPEYPAPNPAAVEVSSIVAVYDKLVLLPAKARVRVLKYVTELLSETE